MDPAGRSAGALACQDPEDNSRSAERHHRRYENETPSSRQSSNCTAGKAERSGDVGTSAFLSDIAAGRHGKNDAPSTEAVCGLEDGNAGQRPENGEGQDLYRDDQDEATAPYTLMRLSRMIFSACAAIRPMGVRQAKFKLPSRLAG